MTRHFTVALRLCWALLAVMLAIAPASAQNRGTFFKATANGNTMYLFGTMHLTNPDHYPTDPVLMQAIEQASVMYVENVDRPSTMRMALTALSLFPEPTYKALSPEIRRRLSAQLTRLNVSEGLAVRTHPFVLVALLQNKACPEAKHSDVVVDDYLANRARSNRVPVEGFEDAEFSMDMFNRMSLEARVSAIETALPDLEKPDFCVQEDALRQAWLNADPANLDEEERKMLADTSVFGRYLYQVLVRGRDARMADKLLGLLPQQDRIMVAVGAAHLTGNGSVIDILRSKGVSVERLY